jgi:enolase-phosphatase E1
MSSNARAILLDVEGTTTAIDFVQCVLFPYAEERIERWLGEHATDDEVRDSIEEVRQTARAEGVAANSTTELGALLRRWIREDRKHPGLKRLQGLVWRAGYGTGAFTGHVYPEVPACLRAWKAAGLVLAIYSSGSIEAQRLLFRHSDVGDLSGLLTRHFDATLGPKRSAESYTAIAREMALPPSGILFLSDVELELDAARNGGLQTMQIVRAGAAPGTRHAWAPDFTHVSRRLGLPLPELRSKSS